MHRVITFSISGLLLLFASGCLGPSTGPRMSSIPFRVADHVPSLSWAVGHDSRVPYQEVRRSFHDAYESPVILVVTSAAEWQAYHQKALDQGDLLAGAIAPPPTGVNWDREALLVVGMRDRGAAYAVRVAELTRHGTRLRGNVDVDWSRRLDAIEYSPSNIVKFRKWHGLSGSCRIGPEQVADGLRALRQEGL